MKRIRHDLNEALLNKSKFELNEYWKNRLSTLFQEEGKKMITSAYCILGDMGRAKDACQNACYKMLTLTEGRLSKIKDLRSYIFKMVSNEASHMKKKKIYDSNKEQLAFSQMKFIVSSLESRRNTKMVLDKLKVILKPLEFRIIYLWAYGYTYKDIADDIGGTETSTTIRGKIGRIKTKMRSKYQN